MQKLVLPGLAVGLISSQCIAQVQYNWSAREIKGEAREFQPGTDLDSFQLVPSGSYWADDEVASVGIPGGSHWASGYASQLSDLSYNGLGELVATQASGSVHVENRADSTQWTAYGEASSTFMLNFTATQLTDLNIAGYLKYKKRPSEVDDLDFDFDFEVREVVSLIPPVYIRRGCFSLSYSEFGELDEFEEWKVLTFDQIVRLHQGTYEINVLPAARISRDSAQLAYGYADAQFDIDASFEQVECQADFNRDGQLDFFDELDFWQAWNAPEGADCSQWFLSQEADINGDRQIDFFDYLDLLQLMEDGCDE